MNSAGHLLLELVRWLQRGRSLCSAGNLLPLAADQQQVSAASAPFMAADNEMANRIGLQEICLQTRKVVNSLIALCNNFAANLLEWRRSRCCAIRPQNRSSEILFEDSARHKIKWQVW